jgi:hypothetical protein
MRTVLSSLIVIGLVAELAREASADEASNWEIGATAYGYAVPDQPDFVMVVVPADVRWFHVEGRYNYESLRTGSLFVGLNAGAGDKLRLDVTGMLGGVFGDLDGVAPGLRVTLTWWKLDFSSEDEYVVDVHDVNASFFYNWSELGISPLRWLRLGTVVQRTRVIHTGLDLQRGLLAGVTLFQKVSLTFYELNLGWVTPTYILALGASY